MISRKFEFEGYFTLVVRDSKTLKVKRKTEKFKNLITDFGLNRLGTAGVMQGAAVGTGNAAPLNSDTALQNFLARTTTVLTSSVVVASAAPYYTAWVRTYRFAEGAAAGNLTEVGVLAVTSSPFQLWSRALIVDGSGNPTSITVLANEVLDVVYECRVYAASGDVTGGPVTLLGEQYNWTLRPLGVTANTSQILLSGTNSTDSSTAYSGDLAAETASTPSGVSQGPSTAVVSAYVNNSYSRQITQTWSISQGNAGGGIKSLALPTVSGNGSRFQLGFDKSFPKGSTNTLSISYRYTWARRAI